jgi:hypothetical protein
MPPNRPKPKHDMLWQLSCTRLQAGHAGCGDRYLRSRVRALDADLFMPNQQTHRTASCPPNKTLNHPLCYTEANARLTAAVVQAPAQHVPEKGAGTATESTPSPPSSAPPPGTSVIAVAAGYEHTCALLGDGGVLCWGSNGYGRLGTGDTTDRRRPTAASLDAGACERESTSAIDWGDD